MGIAYKDLENILTVEDFDNAMNEARRELKLTKKEATKMFETVSYKELFTKYPQIYKKVVKYDG